MKRLPKSLPTICLLTATALAIGGCAGRRPIAVSQPPPLSPSPTPAETRTETRNATNASPGVQPAPVAPKPIRSKPAETPAAAGYTEEGNASWYGEPFNGRRASNGEIYDMHKLTAAHRTLPFNSMVRVTNLDNGKSTVVRITDRGPFVANRIIDLSKAAAEQIGAIGPGVVPVRLEVLSGSNPTAGFFTVQVGAFRSEDNAERLRERLSTTYSPIFIQQVKLDQGEFYRVWVGKVSGEGSAQHLADELQTKEGFTPFVVRLDDTSTGGGTP